MVDLEDNPILLYIYNRMFFMVQVCKFSAITNSFSLPYLILVRSYFISSYLFTIFHYSYEKLSFTHNIRKIGK